MSFLDKAKDMAAEAVEKVGHLAGDAAHAVAEKAGEVGGAASHLVDAMKDKASEATHSTMAEKAGDMLNAAKDKVTEAGTAVVDKAKELGH